MANLATSLDKRYSLQTPKLLPHSKCVCFKASTALCAARRGTRGVREAAAPQPAPGHTVTARRGARPVTCRATRLSQDFFPRPWESQHLEDALLSPPTEILLLLGPRACGKTVLLRRTLRNLQATSRIRRSSYIDLTKYDTTDPAALARQLSAGLTSLLAASATASDPFPAGFAAESTSLPGPSLPAAPSRAWDSASHHSDLGPTAAAQLAQVDEPSRRPAVDQPGESPVLTRGSALNLGEVLDAYEQVLAEGQQQQPQSPVGYPGGQAVLALDGCEVLLRCCSGPGEGEEQRGRCQQVDALLRFLVRVGCRERSARVVMASHDGTLVDWLGARIGYGSFRTEVVGDLAHEEVRAFLAHLRPELAAGDVFPPAHLWRVIEVCGGNSGALVRWAAAYQGDVEAALHSVSKDVGTQVREALTFPPPLASPSWTPQQFAAAARVLLHSGPSRAVSREVLLQRLGPRPSGPRALAAMLDHQLLAVRPAASSWARDLSVAATAAAAGPGGGGGGGASAPADGRLVTAASPVHLYKMRVLMEELELGAGWQEGESAQDPLSFPAPATPSGLAGAATDRAAVPPVATLTPDTANTPPAQVPLAGGSEEVLFQEVCEDIWAVEVALQEAAHQVAVLERDQPPGWEQQLGAQRRVVEELRGEKRQLQERARRLMGAE